MGKKKNKNKKKKVNPKKERYAQFRKDKPSTPLTFSTAEITPEQQKQRMADEETINRFLRFNRNRPTRELIERRRKGRN